VFTISILPSAIQDLKEAAIRYKQIRVCKVEKFPFLIHYHISGRKKEIIVN
jgi:hypothetical protein